MGRHPTSALLATLPAFGTLAGESLWLITPHNNSPKLAGRSQINKLYGAMCGLRNMNVIDGLMGICIMVPLITCVWISQEKRRGSPRRVRARPARLRCSARGVAE